MCRDPDREIIVTAEGNIRRVDACMRSLVQWLNDHGILTFDSCCGHGKRWGHVTIRAEDADLARKLGFRVCLDTGVSKPNYPFTGVLDGHANVVLPPIPWVGKPHDEDTEERGEEAPNGETT